MQLFDALPKPIEDALRASITRFGVLVPVVRDQHGETLDGNHRGRLADELGVRYRVDTVTVADDDERREIARTLNADRRHLSEEQRREVAVELRREGHSFRAIAGALGVSVGTAHGDVQKAEQDQVFSIEQLPDRTIGLDGKSRPSRRPTIVPGRDEREAARAQAALTALGDAAPAGRVLDVRRVERIEREHQAEQRRAEPTEQRTVSSEVDIRHGDFREVLADLSHIDAIITDPPYPAEYLPLYDDLGQLARVILSPAGVLAVMTGTRLELLDRVDGDLGRHMRRRHRGIYLTPGPRWRDHIERVATGYKPILLYAHPDGEPASLRWINDDVFTSDRDDKGHHDWGQSEAGTAALVERLTEPGDLVCDPFLGGGTTAVVCKALGRRFVGCDLDAAAVHTSRKRVVA